jgi:hypothetical protein
METRSVEARRRIVTSRGRQRVWERGWEGHEREQLRRLAELSLADKLKWLEDAQQVVRHLSRSSPDLATKSDR